VLGQYAFSNCHALVTFTPSSFPLATDLTGMWYNDSKIVLPVLNLPKASNLTTTFYNVTLTHTAYSGLLQNLAINNSEINLALDVGTSKSDYWSRSYKGTLVARGWTITDGGRYGPTPTAVIGYVPLTINHTKVLETNIHFPWLYDLSKITDTMFWFRVTEPGDIVIMDSAGVVLNDSTIVDTLNKTAKTGTILWDASISTATDKTYRLCICPGYAHQNNKKALTNSHIIARYGMDGGTSPLADGCENYPLTNHTGTLGQTGKIGKSVTLGNTKYLQSGIMTERANATKWGLSMIVKYVDAPDNQWLIIDPGVEEITIKKYYEYLQLYMGSAIFGYSAGLTTYGVNAGDWFYVCVDYDGTQTGNPNRMRVTINGSNATLHGYEGTIPSALAASPNMFRYGYDDATGWHGSIDEVRHSTDAKSTLYRTTEYNSIFDATSVTKGTWLSYDTTKLAQDDPSVDTIRIDTIALTHAYTYTKPMKCLYFHVTSMDSIIFSSRVFCRDSVVYSSNCKITRLFTKGIYTMPGYTLLRRLNGNTHTPHIYNRSKVKWL
jgi:hypothetical protein